MLGGKMYRERKSMIRLKRFEFIDMWDEIMYFFPGLALFGLSVMVLNLFYSRMIRMIANSVQLLCFIFLPLYYPFSDCIPVFLFV